jgi:hypothetical protein
VDPVGAAVLRPLGVRGVQDDDFQGPGIAVTSRHLNRVPGWEP